jgi:hypothetical protein
MNAIRPPVYPSPGNRRCAALFGAACMGIGALWLAGCQKPPAAADAPAHESKAPASPADTTRAQEMSAGVTLRPEQVEKMGILTTPAKAASYTPEAAGYAVVVAHEGLAQGVAELVAALAVERQSGAALARAQRLTGTPGAVPADAMESAARQAAVDQAALKLAKQRLSVILGQKPPWKDTDESVLEALGSGRIKLVRATFPLGALDGTAPASLRLERIDTVRSGSSWRATAPWDAPADASVPGRSFFALLKGSDAAEGERLLAWALVGAPEAGVAIPAAAVIISDNKSWCYVERALGHFVRSEIDTNMPLGEGYFVNKGVAVGDKVVTESAGLLLAREMNPGTAAD